jgi:hypothetical protein
MQGEKGELKKLLLEEVDARSASTLHYSERSRRSGYSQAEVDELFSEFTASIVQQLPQLMNPRLQVPVDNISNISRGYIDGASLVSFDNARYEADLISVSTRGIDNALPSF